MESSTFIFIPFPSISSSAGRIGPSLFITSKFFYLVIQGVLEGFRGFRPITVEGRVGRVGPPWAGRCGVLSPIASFMYLEKVDEKPDGKLKVAHAESNAAEVGKSGFGFLSHTFCW